MKRSNIIVACIISLLLTACLTNKNQFAFGPEHHGKNKLVKTDRTENQSESTLTFEKNAIETRISQSDITLSEKLPDSIKIGNYSLPSSLKLKDSTRIIDKLDEIKYEIISTGNKITRTPIKKARTTDDEPDDEKDAGRTILMVLLIFVGVILLTALVIYILVLVFVTSVLEASGCYIATMTYGSYDHPKVKTLRTFRDEFLAKRKWGKKFISFYYKYSPGVVQKLQNKPIINGIIRANLNAFVFLLRKIN